MMLRALAVMLCMALALPCMAQSTAAAAAAAAAAAPRTAIPYKQEKQGGGSAVFQSVAGLILASLAAYGIVLGLKKMKNVPGSPLRKERRMTLVESTRLSRRSMLHVVDYRGEELLLAESEHGLTLVSSRPAPGAADA